MVWGTDEIANDASQSWRYCVPETPPSSRPASPGTTRPPLNYAAYAPVNDLTLQLIAPNGDVYDAFVLSSAEPATKTPPAASTGWTTRSRCWSGIPSRGSGSCGSRRPGSRWAPRPSAWSTAARPAPTPAAARRLADFEAGEDLFDFAGGAARTAAPGAGHGAFSVKVGGAISGTSETWRKFAIPASATRAVLGYHLFEATEENAGIDGWGFGFDTFTVEIRDLFGNPLAVVDNRNDGWKTGIWMHHAEVDLPPYKGTTVKILFRANNNNWRPTTWWVDDLTVETCGD